MPLHGAPAHVVYQLITDVRKLDATPALNLASFVTTWMEPEAEKLIHESLAVNYVDTGRECLPLSSLQRTQAVRWLACRLQAAR
jgi:glutamate/tyrosine decarboxylase-like PLP-dependent enzyme